MNERIKELIQQATRIVDGGPDMFSMPREIFDKEKFAELIVRECAELSADNAGYNGLNIFDKILKHFGVEE